MTRRNETNTHLAAVTDVYVSQNHGSGTNQDPAPQLRVPITPGLAGSPQSYPVEERAVISHNRRFAKHHPGSVIDHHALTHFTAGVHVHAKHF